MKLSSVVLLSVNLVVGTQVAANAADTASFLQDALSPSASAANAKSSPARAGRPAQHKKRSSKAYVAMTPVVDGVRMRPFVPGRYLPSEADIQARQEAEQQAAQQAQQQAAFSYPGMDPSGMLSGKVSSNQEMAPSPYLQQAASYAMSRPANQAYMHKISQAVKQAARKYTAAHPRSIPGVNPVMPGQIAHFPGAIPEPQQARATMPMRIPQPPVMRQSMPIVPQAPQCVAPQQAPVVPSITSMDTNQLDQLLDGGLSGNANTAFNGDMRFGQGNPGFAGAGPSTYPLSSMQHGRGGMQAPQARFGSWHGGSNLAQASFHSYVPVHMAGPMSVKINHLGNSKKTGHQAYSARSVRTHASQQHHSVLKHVVAKVEKKAPFVAVYPLYRRYNTAM